MGTDDTEEQQGWDREFYKTTSPDRYSLLKDYAKAQRQNMTDAERLLWEELRTLHRGYKFRRQHPIGDYIADFVCLARKLVIEVDGGYHTTAEQQEEDRIRTYHLEQLGYRVIRFTNDEVLGSPPSVISRIKEELYTE